jgi:hypothetical protein
MNDQEFPEIQRGNGVANDALATLADIMKANLSKISKLDTRIEKMDEESRVHQRNNYILLILSILISIIALFV